MKIKNAQIKIFNERFCRLLNRTCKDKYYYAQLIHYICIQSIFTVPNCLAGNFIDTPAIKFIPSTQPVEI